MEIFLWISAACFGYGALAQKSITCAGLFFWVLTLIL